MTTIAAGRRFNILVLDAAQRSALAVVRALGKDLRFNIITADSELDTLAGNSRFTKEHFSHPSPVVTPNEFIAWLGDFCATQNIDLVLPVTEITSQLILMNHSQIPQVKIPFSDYEKVIQLADKWQLVKLALTINLRVPYTECFSSASAINTSNFSYPIVIKPCLSRIFTNKDWVNTAVKVVHDEAELHSHLACTDYLNNYPFMLQEFIPGTGAGVFCLYNKGEPTAFFAHKRLREKPPQGGISVLCESTEVPPHLYQNATALLSAIKWHGVAMIEYRVTPEGVAYLMEVNTRFWGSLQLAVDAGVDFPTLLVASELGLSTKPILSYKIGQRLRWLLGDVDSLYLYLKSNYTTKQKLMRLLEFVKPDFINTKHEVNRWNDWGPAWFEIKTYLMQIIGKK